MKFSLNLVELYNNMTDEYDTPIEEYMDYKEFIEYAKKYGFKIVGSKIVLEISEIVDEDNSDEDDHSDVMDSWFNFEA